MRNTLTVKKVFGSPLPYLNCGRSHSLRYWSQLYSSSVYLEWLTAIPGVNRLLRARRLSIKTGRVAYDTISYARAALHRFTGRV